MPLLRSTKKDWLDFNMPVSYKVNDTDKVLRDASNVFSNQGRLETRHGISRFNSVSLGGAILSVSFFKKSDDTRKYLAKVGTVLYSVAETGAHTAIKTGLTVTTKHRGRTFNDRHIISIEGDGLFQYDGSTFTQIGQAPGSAASIAISSTGSTLNQSAYTVKYTYYSSVTGFESNPSVASGSVTVTATQEQIDITNLPATASNGTIDKLWLYISEDGGSYLFDQEINLGVTTATITANTTSAQTPPTENAAPRAGGGSYLEIFNRKLIYTGRSSNLNDVYFSETDQPDGFSDTSSAAILYITGDGAVTGLATGLYSNSILDPYLVIFKKTSTHIYSELDGNSRFTTIDTKIGCVSNESIVVKNGDVFFLSPKGWRVVADGKLLRDSNNNAITLGDGKIDDIFTSPGYVYELNKSKFSSFFSTYYSELDQIINWVYEGSNSSSFKAYVFEFETLGFKPYVFQVPATCAMTGEDSTGREDVFFGDEAGYLINHSVRENRTDVDTDGAAKNIAAFGIVNWLAGADFDSTYNFRELLLRAVANDNALTVKSWLDFDISLQKDKSYDFSGPTSGFVLDISKLDEGVFNDERTIVTARADINRVGESISIGFYQEATNANINLIAAQIHFSKNKNRN